MTDDASDMARASVAAAKKPSKRDDKAKAAAKALADKYISADRGAPAPKPQPEKKEFEKREGDDGLVDPDEASMAVPSLPGDDDDGVGDVPRGWESDLPPGFPVIPLGKRGMMFYYLNPSHELIELASKEHSQSSIPALLMPHDNLLEEHWPRRTKFTTKLPDGSLKIEWVTTGWRVADCARALQRACTKLGIWKNMQRVRGAGGWKHADGRIMFHCGDTLWVLGADGKPEFINPGMLAKYVYTADAPIIRPHDDAQPGGETGPGHALFALLTRWQCLRPKLDPYLLLGQTGCAMAAGALEWRPMQFVTGDTAAGKSTLARLQREVHGPGGIVKSSDASGPGISSLVGTSCLPVSIDEAENEADNHRADEIIRLARNASSGDVRVRATQNMQGASTQLFSCFSFSAIVMPPLPPQDRRRMGIIRLEPLPKDAVEPKWTEHEAAVLGSKLKRRIADQWYRYPDLVLQMMQMLSRAGHKSDTLKQYGNLMAMSWMMLHDDNPTDKQLDEFELLFGVEHFRETSDTRSNAMNCLDELVQSQPEVFKGGAKKSIAQIVRDMVEFVAKHADASLGASSNNDHADLLASKNSLSATGLALIRARDGEIYLAVPTAHRMVAEIYKNSNWKAKAGTTGGWAEALSRLPGSKMNHSAKVAGRTQKCVLVLLEHVLPPDPVEAGDETVKPLTVPEDF